jgi:Radical SAM superfamily
MVKWITSTKMLLIHPPVAKPCEPPAGIAKLCGALSSHGVKVAVLDANLEGLLSLLRDPVLPLDTWTQRASRHLSRHLSSLKDLNTYHHFDRYKRAVSDLNRLLDRAALPRRVRLGLANYEHQELSPARSADLIKATERPEDNPFYPYFRKRLLEFIENKNPSVVGLSLNYLSQAFSAFAMIGFLKREVPGLTLALGGGLVTSWMRRPDWRDPFKGLVDHLVAGPGEGPLLSIMGIEKGKEEEIIVQHDIPNYDSLPMEEYLSPGPILPYSSSSGCYWNKCLFCPERTERNPYIPIPVKKVIVDLQGLIKKQQPALIHIVDNAINPALMKAISEDPPGVPWYGFARMTPPLTDPDFCISLKRSGCVMLKLGLESGDQRVLDQMQKGINLEEASSALKTVKNAGIATYIYLLFGTPTEGYAEAQRTLEFIVKHHEEIDFLNVAIFNLPVYGPETEQIETRTFYEGDLSLYTDFEHPKGWNRKGVRQFLDKEFKRHPAIASILRRDPPVFTSNHAPFFVMETQRKIQK